MLSQLGALLAGDISFAVPVYVVYGPTEDVRVLEKFRQGDYAVKNLMVVDEAATRLLDVGGVKLRLLGLGGSLQMSKICGLARVAGAARVANVWSVSQSTTARVWARSRAVTAWCGLPRCRSASSWIRPSGCVSLRQSPRAGLS